MVTSAAPGRAAGGAARPVAASVAQVAQAIGEGVQRFDRSRIAGLLASLGWRASFPDGEAAGATVHAVAVDRALVMRYDGSPFTAARSPRPRGAPHPSLAIVEVVHEGTGCVTASGVESLVGPGDVLLHPPHGSYRCEWTSSTCRRTYTVLHTAVLGRRPGPVLRTEDLVQRCSPLAPAVTSVADLVLDRDVDRLVRGGAGAALGTLLGAVVAGAIDRGADPDEPELRERARAVLLERFTDPTLDADAVARELRISRRHLFAQFEGASETFATTLRDIRLEHAAQMLVGADDGLAVRRVAREAGFAGPAQLARAFRDRYGTTPTQFRAVALRGRSSAPVPAGEQGA